MLGFVACGKIWGGWKACTYFEVKKGLLKARHGNGVGLSLVTIMQEWQLKIPSRVAGVWKSDQIKDNVKLLVALGGEPLSRREA